MKIGSTHKISNSSELNLFIGIERLVYTHNHKLLGVYLDETLTFQTHIDKLCSKMSSKITLLYYLSKYVSKEIRKQFFSAYIQSLIDFSCTVWCNTTFSNIDRINNTSKECM